MLFRDVMGITASTLRFVAGLSLDDRTHADSLTAKWNKEIDERLNLSHYWQQDDSFALRVNYKQGILFFEITDKTGATYTFRERSSGLRYFLSYYIQAKSLEMTSRGRNAIVLMDEPDSFLSILGQRNLLAVFESLVRAESSAQDCQLVYTTHSPFLINRNYPRRLRLVRKGDAEEGTQLIDQAMLRRYEPVRSALGIDCAQTLFMGATNVVVEGPTDQYLLSELIRKFITPDKVSELLDLNSVVMVSAERLRALRSYSWHLNGEMSLSLQPWWFWTTTTQETTQKPRSPGNSGIARNWSRSSSCCKSGRFSAAPSRVRNSSRPRMFCLRSCSQKLYCGTSNGGTRRRMMASPTSSVKRWNNRGSGRTD